MLGDVSCSNQFYAGCGFEDAGLLPEEPPLFLLFELLEMRDTSSMLVTPSTALRRAAC